MDHLQRLLGTEYKRTQISDAYPNSVFDPLETNIGNARVMHSLLTFGSLLLCLSFASLPLASTLVLPDPALNLSSATPPLAATQRFHCVSQTRIVPINPRDCYFAVNDILTTPGASTISTFGERGTYRGPFAWRYNSCKILLAADRAYYVRAPLMLFAQVAATVTKTCARFDSVPYHGGSSSWVGGELRDVVVVVGRALDYGLNSTDIS